MTEPSPPSPPEMTLEAAAVFLDISVGHVRELVSNGFLRSQRDGGSTMVRVEDVEAFARRRTEGLAAARRLADIVNRSPEGWDS